MENLFSMWKVRELADKVTNVVMNYTEIEAKVREATNDEPWGPTGQIMQDLAHSTFTYEHFPEVMSMLWKRMLQDNKQHWRRTYKSLLVLHYLIKNGSERVVTSAREHIYDLRSLENYTYIDDVGKDQGVNIRHKVKEMIDFIQDDDRLREERKKAKKNKDKFIGMSSDMMSMRFGSSRDASWEDRSYSGGGRDAEWEDGGANRYRDHRTGAGSYDDDCEPEQDDSDDGEATSNKNNKRFQNTTSPTHSGVDKSSTSPPAFEKKVNLNLTANAVVSSPSKKQNKVLKKVDLGAAAHFGRNDSLPTQTDTVPYDDLFNAKTPRELPDEILEFDPRADSSTNAAKVTSQSKQAVEFGDFESVFGPPSSTKQPANDDGFADFSSAFTMNQQQSTATQPVQNVLSGNPRAVPTNPIHPEEPFMSQMPTPKPLIPPLGAVQTPATPAQTSAAADLLSDLNFSSLQIQQTAPHIQNNNFGFDLLDGLNPGSRLGTMPGEVNLLQPSSITNNNVTSNQEKGETHKTAQPVGSTWGNINIDLDNLLVNKPKKGPSPSMNQLATNPNTSPVRQPMVPIAPLQSQNDSQQQFFAAFK
ncbi:unnamed protein product [Acanthoscelides obtectus]|uniref:ENTH domain-containing protein n=1 Tax=Acanthoscelides obtectus TaxID=200917 RepID=A0A9P0MFE3_ACAOB|nr:unnamed protein product [Acanthoscelides obtectus]CAK1689232.1 Clathrin interactor 1 [Acanthoscelides obtectus]